VSDLSKLAQQYGLLIHGYCMMTKDRLLAKDLDRPRPRCRIMNNEDVTRTPDPFIFRKAMGTMTQWFPFT
jgi:hypothetical protein